MTFLGELDRHPRVNLRAKLDEAQHLCAGSTSSRNAYVLSGSPDLILPPFSSFVVSKPTGLTTRLTAGA